MTNTPLHSIRVDRRQFGQRVVWAAGYAVVFLVGLMIAAVALRRASRPFVGLSGSIYRTADAAETWQRVHRDPSAALYDVSMADGEHGWAVGDGRLLATRDAGRSWRLQPLPDALVTARIRAVAAVDARHAVAVGLAGVRLRTLDAGRRCA